MGRCEGRGGRGVVGWKRCVGRRKRCGGVEEVCGEEEEVCEDGEGECREVVGGRVVGRRRERWGEEEVRTVCGGRGRCLVGGEAGVLWGERQVSCGGRGRCLVGGEAGVLWGERQVSCFPSCDLVGCGRWRH